MNKLALFSSLFPDLEKAALSGGRQDQLADAIERLAHVYFEDTPSRQRPKLLEALRLQLQGGAADGPQGLTDPSAAAAMLERALEQTLAARRAAGRRRTAAAPGPRKRPPRAPSLDPEGRAPPPTPADAAGGPRVAERLLLAQEEERHQIAMELHDSTSQHLVAVSLGLTRLRRLVRTKRAERQLVDDVSHALQDALREIRTFSYLMNPPQLERDGLEAVARRFTAGFESRTAIRTSLAVAGGPDASSLVVQHTLYRVLQEALTDIHRRGSASEVEVSLTRRAGWITLKVGDNAPVTEERGQQGARAPVGVGVGVSGMQAPLVELGGSLKILCGADGDQIIARLPAGLRLRDAPGDGAPAVSR